MLRHFHQSNKPVQKDHHHFLVVNQHAIFTLFSEIMEIGICSLVLPFVGGCVPKPYDLPHEIRDIVPFIVKMPNDLGTLTETPIFCRIQFDIPVKNP